MKTTFHRISESRHKLSFLSSVITPNDFQTSGQFTPIQLSGLAFIIDDICADLIECETVEVQHAN